MITCVVATPLEVGATTTVSIPVAVPASAASSYTGGSASVFSAATDPNLADNTTSSTVGVDAAVIDLVVSANTPTITPGVTGTVLLTVTNAAAGSAAGPFTVLYSPPTGVSITPGIPAGCAVSLTGLVGCSIPGPLAGGDSTTIALVVRVTTTAIAGALPGGRVTVSSASAESSLVNNSAPATIVAGPPVADLSVSITNPTIAAGETGTATLTVANAGPSAANTVVVTYSPPAGLVVVPASLPAGCFPATGLAVRCTVASVASGGHVTLPLVLAVDAAVPVGTATGGRANVSSAATDPIPASNVAASVVGVQAQRVDVSIASVTTPVLSPAGAGTLTVALRSSVAAPNGMIDLLYRLSDQLAANPASPSWDSRCTVTGALVRCHLGPSLDTSMTISIPVLAPADLPSTFTGGSVFLSNITVNDPVLANNGPLPANPTTFVLPTAVRHFYYPVNPERFLETRPGEPLRGVPAAGKTTAGQTIELQITGVGDTNIPADASAVVLNMTVDDPSADGYVTVWPCGSLRPNASNLNATAGMTAPNLVMAKIGEGGKVCIFTQNPTHVIADVNGWFPANVPFVPVTPERFLETRPGEVVRGVDAAGKTTAGQTIALQVTNVLDTNIPADAAAVVLNVTVDDPSANGFVTVWPCGQERPNASNLNATAGRTAPNLVIAKVGEGGKVCIFTQNPTHVIADVNGWFPAGTPYVGVQPERFLETRPGEPLRGVGAAGKTESGQAIELQITGVGKTDIPADASAVVLNMTVDDPSSNGFVTVWPCGSPRPNASNLNATVPFTRPNLVIAKIGDGGKVCVYTQSPTHIIADVNGWFPAEPALTG